jgi:hypothetical protein
VTIFLPTGRTSAVIDTGAQSFWVDKEWFLSQGGTIEDDKIFAEGADGGRLSVAGKGVLPWFTLWGHRGFEQAVRVMENLPSKVLIGSEFWRKYALKLDLQRLCGEIDVEGQTFLGPVSTNMDGDFEVTQQVSQTIRDTDENMLEIEETKTTIKEMDLSSFSDESEEVNSMRSLLWEFKDICLGMGLVKDIEHKIELLPGAVPYCATIRRRSPAQEDAERMEVNKLVSLGVMEPAI